MIGVTSAVLLTLIASHIPPGPGKARHLATGKEMNNKLVLFPGRFAAVASSFFACGVLRLTPAGPLCAGSWPHGTFYSTDTDRLPPYHFCCVSLGASGSTAVFRTLAAATVLGAKPLGPLLR